MTLDAAKARRRRVDQRYRRLVQLGFRSYREYLRSGHWAGVKGRYRASDEPQDCICGETERIQLHHLTYERVGAEELSDLTPLCPPCHAMIHALERRGEMGLDFAGLVNEKRAERNRAALDEVESRFAVERRAEIQPVLDAFANLERAINAMEPWQDGMVHLLYKLRGAARSAERKLLSTLPT